MVEVVDMEVVMEVAMEVVILEEDMVMEEAVAFVDRQR